MAIYTFESGLHTSRNHFIVFMSENLIKHEFAFFLLPRLPVRRRR